MLLTIDIGNTNITLGLYDGQELVRAWRLATVHERMPDEYGLQLLGLLEHAELGESSVQDVALASVVPPLTGSFTQACHDYLGLEPFVVDAGVKTGLSIRYEDPKHALGADRVGRIWYGEAGERAIADALASLTLILGKLSERDRPLSEVLDADETAH